MPRPPGERHRRRRRSGPYPSCRSASQRSPPSWARQLRSTCTSGPSGHIAASTRRGRQSWRHRVSSWPLALPCWPGGASSRARGAAARYRKQSLLEPVASRASSCACACACAHPRGPPASTTGTPAGKLLQLGCTSTSTVGPAQHPAPQRAATHAVPAAAATTTSGWKSAICSLMPSSCGAVGAPLTPSSAGARLAQRSW
mmetsp:Transcript_105090/g.297499  ORF Transcript_105090/g.297499 Transcript_105090/m.297499 type:complete len:200 (-) Transcript_105090:982-1581(-)